LSLVSKRFGVMGQALCAKELCRFHELLWISTGSHEVAVNSGPLRSEFSTERETLWSDSQGCWRRRSAFLDGPMCQQATPAQQ